MSWVFDSNECPEGCRCGCCDRLFDDGDVVVDRAIPPMFSVPTCEVCAEREMPLMPSHPLASGRMPTLRADGTVE